MGLVGFAAGVRHGLEVQLFGLVAGINFANPGIKLPGFGELSVSELFAS